MMNSILDAKEKRQILVNSYLELGYAVITIKSNIPGEDKHLKEAYILCRLFFNLLNNLYTQNISFELNYADGPWILMKIEHKNLEELKKHLITIENEHPLGRFIDLDLHTSMHSISRNSLGLPLRKCFICELDAFTCQRLHKHEISELTQFIKVKTRAFLKEEIKNIIDKSIMLELNLDYKFGLVTKSSRGSHRDMDYKLMLKAKNAIIPHLVDVYLLGYDSSDYKNLMHKARFIGLQAELDMLKATDQVNCYKGLIFVLGLFLLSTGVSLSRKMFKPDLYKYLKLYTKDLFTDFNSTPDTFGKKAYETHHILGVRGEAILGFPSIQHVINLYHFNHDLSDQTLRHILRDLIIVSEDTVLLKRAGSLDKYYETKELIKKVNINSIEEVKSFTDYAISNNLSFGGSADLLIAYLYLKHIHHNLLI